MLCRCVSHPTMGGVDRPLCHSYFLLSRAVVGSITTNFTESLFVSMQPEAFVRVVRIFIINGTMSPIR